MTNVFISLNEELEKLRNIYDKNSNNKNSNKETDKDKENNNLIITLLKNVEKLYLNK